MTNETESPHNPIFHQLVTHRLQRWDATMPREYWEYRQKWNAYPINHTVGSFPIHLDIEATNACNLKCVMCPRTDMVEAGTFWKVEMFDFATYKRLIDEGMANGLCSVKYNYLGEPTLNPQLIEMIEYAKQAGVLDIMFNTNATQLTEELAYQLLVSGLDKLIFSFDSPYRERYNEIRVGADYDKVLSNIRRFNEIRGEMVKPLTRAHMVRMTDNEHEWEAFQELFEPIVDVVSYGNYIDHVGQSKPEYTLMPSIPSKNGFCCPELWQRMFVHPDGVVTACCIDSIRSLQTGNIFEQSAHDIWVGEKYQRLRDLHTSGHFDEIPTCASCALAKIPTKGVIA